MDIGVLLDMYVCVYTDYIRLYYNWLLLQIQIRCKQNTKQTKQDTKRDTLHLGSIHVQPSVFWCTYQGNYECPCMHAAVLFPYQVD